MVSAKPVAQWVSLNCIYFALPLQHHAASKPVGPFDDGAMRSDSALNESRLGQQIRA
jgi:hypothetical protein